MNKSKKRSQVLDIGQCSFDHRNIKNILNSLNVDVERASSSSEAINLINENTYDLIMVNRIFDRDGTSGIEFIKNILLNDNLEVKILLISDRPDSQSEALEAGALKGFGKGNLKSVAVSDLLKSYLFE